MNLQKSHIIFLILATLFLAVTFLPLFASERILDAFGREDGVFENLTALYLFLTSVIFAASLLVLKKRSWLMKLSYAGLALLFFFGAGEEISWGERIFHWDDRNLIRGINVQGELTLHNLKYFQGEDSFLPVSASQIFIIFAFTIAVLIPLGSTFFPGMKRLVAPHFPVLPLYPGLLVVLTYVIQKLMLRVLPLVPGLYKHPSMPVPQGVHEIREHGYTFALLAAALIYFSTEWAAKKAAERQAIDSRLAAPAPAVPFELKNKGEKI